MDRIKQEEVRALTEEEAAAQSFDLLRLGDQWPRLSFSCQREGATGAMS
jgi:hypothetical protein